MNKTPVRLVSVVLVISMLLGGFSIIATDGVEGTSDAPSIESAHGVIRIDSDAGFASIAASEGWQGDGSAGNPYVIENYEIDANGSNGGKDAIYIGNTTCHFIIRNCSLYDSTTGNPSYYQSGILIYSATNGTIYNNTITSLYYGVCLHNRSSGISIVKNNITSCKSHGIYLYENSSSNTVTENSISSAQRSGIELYDNSSYNEISGNNISYQSIRGIHMSVYSNHNNITDNSINSCWYGVQIDGKTSYNRVSDNNINESIEIGVLLSGTSFNRVESNEVFNSRRWGIQLQSAENNLIANNSLTSASKYDGYGGMSFVSASDMNTVLNNTIYRSGTKSLSVENSVGNELRNNTISDIYGDGIYVFKSNATIIENDTVSDGSNYGIYLESSPDTRIRNNTVLRQKFGIYLESPTISLDYNCTVSDNNASSNTNVGIFASCAGGSLFAGNIASMNGQDGIHIGYSPNCTVANNTLASNGGAGIYLETNFSTMSGNILLNNGLELWGEPRDKWNTHNIDTTNKVNGKPLYYFRNLAGVSAPAGAGQIILANCTDSVLSGANIGNATVGIEIGFSSNISVSESGLANHSEEGVYLYRSNDCAVTGSFLNDSYYGVAAYYSENISVQGNFMNRDMNGVHFSNSANLTAEGNTFSDSTTDAIYVSDSAFSAIITNNTVVSSGGYGIHVLSSDGAHITENNISDGGNGISLSACENSNIIDNLLTNNNGGGDGKGIELLSGSSNAKLINNTIIGSDHGMEIENSHGQIIENNTLTANYARAMNLFYCSNSTIAYNNMTGNQNGIFLRYSSNNSVFENLLKDNTAYALDIYDESDNNTIYHNYLINNTSPYGQARDTCANFWNLSYPDGGNYWSDYSGSDIFKGPNQDQQGQDGYGDSPYSIYDGGNQDMYPLMKPWNGTVPSDTESPSVVGTNPLNNSADVAVSQQIIVSFSEFLNQSSLTYTCTPDPGGWTPSWSSTTPTLTLYHTRFAYNATYTFTITGGEDLSGKALANVPYTITFKTEADTTPPTVIMTYPSNGSAVPSSSVTVTWSGWDNQTGIDHFDISVDGGAWINVGNSTSYALSLPDGMHNISVRATDGVGNVGLDHVTFTVDTEMPIISIVSPADGYAFPVSSVLVEWNGSDGVSGIDHYEIRMDSGSWVDVGTDTNHTFSGLAEGNHTVDVRAVDMAGNDGTDSISFWVDLTAPSVVITSPKNGQLLNTSTVEVIWAGWDNESGIDHYDFSSDGGATWTDVGLNTSRTVSCLADGTQNFGVMIFDMAGNNFRANASVTIDTQEPHIWINNPHNDTGVNVTQITVSWSVYLSYNHSEVSMDGQPWVNAGKNLSMDFTGLSEGVHEVRIKAVDNAGNWNYTSAVFYVDFGAPSVEPTYPVDIAVNGYRINFTWNGSDSLSGIDHYDIMIDGDSWVGAGNSPWYENILYMGDGNHTFVVRATDKAGNQFVSASASFAIDSMRPSVTVYNPSANGYWNGTEIDINWTGSDSSYGGHDGSGIKHYEVSVNGGEAVDVGLSTHYLVTGLSEGVYTVRVFVYDCAGNVANSTTDFTVDMTPPSVEILSPEDGYTTADSVVTVEWSGSDEHLSHYEIRIDEGNWTSTTSSDHDFFVGGNERTCITHTVYVRAWDSAGNLGRVAFVNFTVDYKPPVVLEYSPAGDNVSQNAPIVVLFDEPIDTDSPLLNIVIRGHSSVGIVDEPMYAGDITWNGSEVTFTCPDGYGAGYEVWVYMEVPDLYGNIGLVDWRFNTSYDSDSLGTVSGRLLDLDGNPLAGAFIIIGDSEAVMTDDNGFFTLSLPGGEYDLNVTMDGDLSGEVIGSVHLSVTPGGDADIGDVQMLESSNPADDDGSGGLDGGGSFMYVMFGLLVVVIAALFFMKKKGVGAEESGPADKDGEAEEVPCPNCGTMVNRSVAVCYACGHTLEGRDAEPGPEDEGACELPSTPDETPEE